MADTFPPSDTAELNTCGDEEEEEEGIHLGEEMDEDFTVQLGATYSCRKADGTYHEAEVLKMRTNKRAKRDEYMVRYFGTGRRQTEWVDKSRLMQINPEAEEEEEEEVMEEGSEQEVSESDQTLEYIKPDENEPEIKKAKVEGNGDALRSILSSGDFAEELTCLLCSKPYEDPVMVECGHNFCRNCVDKAWTGEGSFTCPDCKEELTEKTYTANRALAKLLLKTLGSSITQVQMSLPVKNCPEHDEAVKVYCKDDGDLCCIICQDSLRHANHTFLPIMEAVGVYRTQLSGLINPLEEALAKTDEFTIQRREHIKQHQPTMDDYRRGIVSDFEKLNNFVKEQKENLLQKFHEQRHRLLEEMKTNAIKMEETRDYLKEAVAEANERVNDGNSLSFLTGVKQFIEKIKEQQKVKRVSAEALIKEELCRGTFKAPIQYIVWKHMKSIIGPIPEGDDEPMPSKIEVKKETMEPAPKASAISQQIEAEESDDDEEQAAQVPDSADMDMELPAWIYKGRKEIWIVGDGYITSASRDIEKSPYGYNLGFPHPNCNVRWLTSVKFWSLVMPKLQKEFDTYRRPDVIFIHVGTGDLKRKASDEIKNSLSKYLADLSQEFRRVAIVLSAILPRKEWLGTSREGYRKSFNAALCQLAGKRRFYVAQHEDLEMVLTERFKMGIGDRFLTTPECNTFLKNIRNAVLSAMSKDTQNAPEKSPGKTVSAQGTSSALVKTEKGSNSVTKPITIWLVGNVYISRAHRHAEKQPYGENLGMKGSYCRVRWLGRTTRWNLVIPEMKRALSTLGAPNIVFLHVGTDDLETTSYDTLVNEMRNTLGRLTHLFSGVKFLLSTVLPTIEWMGGPLEECRMMFNTRLGNYAEKHGFHLVKLYKLEMKILSRFRGKDKHGFLSASENDMFITIVKDYLLNTMMHLNNRTASKK